MSDDKQPPKPPAPMKKTSAVPLKKETVRVTLKAEPSAPAPSAPKPPSVAAAPKPPAPAPTIPLRTAPAAAAPKPSGAPAPAPTIPLRTQAAPATVALSAGGAKALPQATVQLQNTQPLGAPTAPTTPQIGTINSSDDDDVEESDTIPTVMSILAFVLALAVVGIGVATWTLNDIHTIGDLFS